MDPTGKRWPPITIHQQVFQQQRTNKDNIKQQCDDHIYGDDLL